MGAANDYFEQKIFEMAKELDIVPKLLLAAIGTLAENEQASEEEIINRYKKEVLDELKEEAIIQIKSPDKKTREAAEYALAEARSELVEVVREQNPPYNNIDDYVTNGERLKNYHMDAWNLITDELLNTKNKYRKVLGKTDMASIIKLLCPDEIRQYQDHMTQLVPQEK